MVQKVWVFSGSKIHTDGARKVIVPDRGRASGLYRVGITGTESHASPFTKWSKIRDCNGDFRVLNGYEQYRSKGIESVKGK